MDFKNLKLKGGNKKMIKMKKERGITLIALVVTIVVLLILAGVSINAIFNENGLIKKAQEAQNKMDQATENDQKELNNLNEWIENVTNEGENTKVEEVSVETAAVLVTLGSTEKYYANLSGIAKILENGSKVTMIKDCSENTDIQFNANNITLESDYKTISGTGKIINNGSLTINSGIYSKPIENKNTLIINGGTFTAAINISSGSELTIYGGDFNGEISVDTNSTVVIMGGTFITDVSQYVPDGYEVTRDSNSGMYIVTAI